MALPFLKNTSAKGPVPVERIRELLEKFHSRIDFHNTENDKK